MRLIFSLFIALGISLGIFFGMHLMTSSKNTIIKKEQSQNHLVYLREKKNSEIQKKKRVKPKEPPKKTPVKNLKIVKMQSKPKLNKQVKIKPFKTVSKNIELSKISSLSGAQIELSQSFLDANSLKAVKKINPKYPRKAKFRKQEGFVKLSFTIDKEGLVSNVKVLEAKPKGVFEESSIKAIKRWRFKKHEKNRQASIKFNFRLAR